MSYHIVYITTESVEQARELARQLVSERLAACANIWPKIESIYRWQDEMQSASEVALILKTTDRQLSALQDRARELHPYECPCIVSWPLAAGNPDYFHWLTSSTG